MKKTYVLLSVMVLALVTAGFSYAYWTDTLTVTGKAQTGDLTVEWTEEEAFRVVEGDAMDVYYDEIDIQIVRPDVLEIAYKNLYPGSKSRAGSWYHNVGTIPAKLTNVRIEILRPDGEVDWGANEASWQYQLISHMQIGIRSHDADGNMIPTGDREWIHLEDAINVVDGIYYFDFPVGLGVDRILPVDPGVYNKLMVVVWVDDELGNIGQDKVLKFEVTLEFDQYTVVDPS